MIDQKVAESEDDYNSEYQVDSEDYASNCLSRAELQCLDGHFRISHSDTIPENDVPFANLSHQEVFGASLAPQCIVCPMTQPKQEQESAYDSSNNLQADAPIQTADALTAAYSPDGAYVAVGFALGSLKILKAASQQVVYSLGRKASITSIPQPQPCTAVRYLETDSNSPKNLLGVCKGSTIALYHATTGKQVSSTQEGDNAIHAMDARSAEHPGFCTAGYDGCLRVYDASLQQVCTLSRGEGGAVPGGHSNVVQAVCCSKNDPNVIISGGWDRTVQIWDIRVPHAVNHISGPYICGDGLDIQQNRIVAASWRTHEPLQIYDLASTTLKQTLPFYSSRQSECKLYSAKFGRGPFERYVFAGGSGKNPVFRMIDTVKGQVIGSFECDSDVHCIAMEPKGKGLGCMVVCRDELVFVDVGGAVKRNVSED